MPTLEKKSYAIRPRFPAPYKMIFLSTCLGLRVSLKEKMFSKICVWFVSSNDADVYGKKFVVFMVSPFSVNELRYYISQFFIKSQGAAGVTQRRVVLELGMNVDPAERKFLCIQISQSCICSIPAHGFMERKPFVFGEFFPKESGRVLRERVTFSFRIV